MLSLKSKETTKGGLEGQAPKRVVGKGGNGRAAPRAAASHAAETRCVSLWPGRGSADFTRSSWANCHPAAMRVVETSPLTHRAA